MSWSDLRRWSAVSVLALLPLAGCFQPLYGTLGPGGLESELQAIKVQPIPERVGHYVENELVFGLNGSRAVVAPKYKLVVTLKERVQTPVIDTVTFRTTSATVVTDADIQLFPIAGTTPIYKSVAFAAASYDRFSQRFSNVRAARDSEQRDARVLADNIRQQIAAFFAARGS